MIRTSRWRPIAVVGLTFCLLSCRSSRPSVPETDAMDSYTMEVRKFQRDREAALKAATGWLTIAGLYFLSQPSETFGSDPTSDIVLPSTAPKHAGVFEQLDGKVSVKAATGVTFRLGDKSVTSDELKSDADGAPDKIGLGDVQLWVHMSGKRLSIRLRDPNYR